MEPTVPERQRVERLIAAVMSGLDASQAVGTVTDRMAIVTAVMLQEAAESDDPRTAPRLVALEAIFEAMSPQAR